jgi:hypothetical protein
MQTTPVSAGRTSPAERRARKPGPG